MPLLAGSSGRFAPSKIEQRIKKGCEVFNARVAELPDEVEFSLGGNDLIFRDGQWSSLGNSDASIVSGPRREAVRKLEEENNLLKAKLELVMDMLTEVTAQSCLQTKEINLLRAKLRK